MTALTLQLPPSLCSLANNQLCGLDGYGRGTYNAEGISKIAEMLAVNTTLQSIKYACLRCACL